MKRRNKWILGGIAAGSVVAGAAAGVGTVMAARRTFRALERLRGDDLRGLTVLITGSSRGLGLALAEEFARHGCNVVLCARDENELMRARQQVEKLGAEVGAVACDLTKPEQVQHLIDSARRQFGHIDILVNNAGIITVGPLSAQSLEDFREAMDVIFWGTVRPTLAVLPEMVERRQGRIVNITSIGGKVSIPHLVPYSCAKFAAVGFSEGLHAELKKFGIHVLTVVPGLMRTGSHLNAFFKGRHQEEFGWFALSGTNPLLSVSAEHAARRVVSATRRKQVELTIGSQARLLALAHGVAPGLVTEGLALVNRLLPSSEAGSIQKKSGKESQSAVTRSPLTALGRRAARRYNQAEEIA
jgi:short-subunit dehydrogenase